MIFFQSVTQAYSEKEIPSSPNRSRTYDLPITSSVALPLSYRRLVGAKAIKLGWDNSEFLFPNKGLCHGLKKYHSHLFTRLNIYHHISFSNLFYVTKEMINATDVQPTSYGYTWEVLELLSGTHRARFFRAFRENLPRASITR